MKSLAPFMKFLIPLGIIIIILINPTTIVSEGHIGVVKRFGKASRQISPGS